MRRENAHDNICKNTCYVPTDNQKGVKNNKMIANTLEMRFQMS